MNPDLEAKVTHLESLLKAGLQEHTALAEQHHQLALQHAALLDEHDQLLITMNRYRQALVVISDSESGIWGVYAHRALHPERDPS